MTQDFENQRVGIATNTPQITLDVNGGMRIGQMTTAEINAITCDANKLGTLLFDTDEDKVKVCKSGGWAFAVDSFGNMSCLDLLNSGNTTSGVYEIDPDGEGGNVPFNVYCDMTTDGGGWTYLMNPYGVGLNTYSD